MSNELLPCPYCGTMPEQTTFEPWKCYCPARYCSLYRIAMREDIWNGRFVRLDKKGGKVFVGDDFNFISPGHPPIKLHFLWDAPQLRYLYQNEQGVTWKPTSSNNIELINESEDQE